MSTTCPFKNRQHAGRQLALALRAYKGRPEGIILALPRGGVSVGYAVSMALGLELDILLVKKLGLPGFEEFAMGAVGSGGTRVLNRAALRTHHISAAQIDAACLREQGEIGLRENKYRRAHAPPLLRGRTVILVDDGIATGCTMQAAIQVARSQHVGLLVAASPVGAADTCARLLTEVDELVCLSQPPGFDAVSEYYQQFEQVSDEEVQDMLALAWHKHALREGLGAKEYALRK